jgi:hypothetical protein
VRSWNGNPACSVGWMVLVIACSSVIFVQKGFGAGRLSG